MQKYYNKKYFSWQSRVGEFGGRANLSKFAKFIRPDHHVIDYGCGGGYLLKNIKCKEADNKQKLGIAAGLPVATSSVAIIDAGDAGKDIAGLK